MQQHIFHFVDEPRNIEHGQAFVARVRKGITTERELLRQLAVVLNFPGYFGENWNALYDCLRDFEWIDERDIILLHEEIPLLGDRELAATYLAILRDAVKDWQRPEEDHELIVCFPEHCHTAVEQLLTMSEN